MYFQSICLVVYLSKHFDVYSVILFTQETYSNGLASMVVRRASSVNIFSRTDGQI